jgi:hypothetical protein
VELRSGYFDSEVERAERQLEMMAGRHGAIMTYGVDGHRAEDMERFVNDRALAQKTVGQTAGLVERVRPDLRWSNLG